MADELISALDGARASESDEPVDDALPAGMGAGSGASAAGELL